MSATTTRTTRVRYLEFIDRHEVAWELAFAVLALVYVAVGFAFEDPPPAEVIALDLILTAVFAAEFTTRLVASYDRRAYLRGHWIDAVALVPAVRGARMLRLLRLVRLVRAFAGVGRAVSTMERLAKHQGLLWLLIAWGAVVAVCSIAFYAAESGVNPHVTSPLDALWWGIGTMTTAGYGDVYPRTPEGRWAAAALMLLGISLFSAITATVTSFMLSSRNHTTDLPSALRDLAELRERGALTEPEFVAAKAKAIEGD